MNKARGIIPITQKDFDRAMPEFEKMWDQAKKEAADEVARIRRGPHYRRDISCPVCGAYETTVSGEVFRARGVVYRTRECSAKHRFKTCEHVVEVEPEPRPQPQPQGGLWGILNRLWR